MKYIISLSFIAVFLSNCTPLDVVYRLRVYNNSNAGIAFIPGYNYPDTSVPLNKRELRGVASNDYAFFDSKEKWENVIGRIPGKKISFFFFSQDTMNHYGWDSVGWNAVRNGYKVLLRKDLTLDDLKASNYHVTYP